MVPEDHPRPEAALYVLDQRPVLLPMRVMRAPGGRIDIAFLHEMISVQCPPGYCIFIEGGSSSPGAANHYRTVDFGDVIRVEFRARRGPGASLGSQVQATGAQDAQDPTTNSDTHTVTDASSSASRDAGTGGSCRDRAGGPPSTNHGAWEDEPAARPPDVALSVNQVSAGLALLCVWSLACGVKGSIALCHRPLLSIMLLLYTMQQTVVGVQIAPFAIGDCIAHSECRSSLAARVRATPRPLFSHHEEGRPALMHWSPGWCAPPVPPPAEDSPVPVGHGDDLETLLEQSLRSADSRAMFLAATLVEALLAHFRQEATPGTDNLPCGNCQDTVTLPLAEHLPAARTFDLTSVQVHLGCTVDHVATLIHGGLCQLAPVPHIPSGPAKTWTLDRPPADADASPHNAKAIEIFTDGSFDGATSAWAFHVSGDWGNGFRSIGSLEPCFRQQAQGPRHNSAYQGKVCRSALG